MNKKILDFIRSFLTWFAVFYLIMWGYNSFFGGEKEIAQSDTSITLKTTKKSITLGGVASWDIENNSNQSYTLASACTNPETITAYRLTNGKRLSISDFSNCGERQIQEQVIAANSKTRFDVKDFNHELFNEAGTYFIAINLVDTEGEVLTIESDQTMYKTPGFFRRAFRGIISKPLFNLLVKLTQVLPGNSLGWAIVILTLLVRLALFIPNQKSMRSQRELQKLQPKIAELKKKYGNNKQAIAMKTMELYKTHKVNPMSSCLPMLIQLPVMLGVYYIVQDGVSWHMSYLLYPFNDGINLSNVVSQFLGMNLEYIPSQVFDFGNISKTWIYVLLPLFVAGMQWIAIRMSFVQAKKRKTEQPKKSKKPAKNEKPSLESQMQNMTGVMQWAMPAMIAFFTFTFPAAVGIYWVTSTIFSIGQQKYVNWKLDKPQVRKKVS